jgi:hypothetical protein
MSVRLTLMAAWALVACSQVGAPLVDEWPGGEPAQEVLCTPPPCAALPELTLDERPDAPIDLAGCAGQPSAPLGSDGRPGPAGPDAADARDLSELAAQASCETLSAAQSSDDAHDDVTLMAANWSRVNLSLASDSERQLLLREATLAQVFIRLEGPVLLRIERSRDISGLRVLGVATAAGSPRVELEQVHGSGVVIGAADQRFAGSVALRDTTLAGSQLEVDELSLESVVLTQSAIDASSMLAIDTSLMDGTLVSESARLATFSGQHTRLRFCGESALFGSELHDSTIAGCDDSALIRLYGSKLISGSLDGQIESDQAYFEHVRIGASAKTSLVMFGGQAHSSAFCATIDKAEFGFAAAVSCSTCDDAFTQPDVACDLPASAPPQFMENSCELLKDKPPPVDCRAPYPERIRPILELN